VAATLLILLATELPTPLPRPSHVGPSTPGYNIAATAASLPAGRLADRLGPTRPVRVLAAGVA
jgi:hypothetical protein